MKIAIISDLHGNLEALSSLPYDYDELWVLGDLVNYGPDPGPIVDCVRQRASVVIRGNHDNALGFGVDPRCSPPFVRMAAEMAAYTDRMLSSEQKQYLRDLPIHVIRNLDGHGLYLCHAIPSDPLFGYCPAQSPQWLMEMRDLPADFLLVGHTHVQVLQKAGHGQILNPGSIGQPKSGNRNAQYAMWDKGHIELRSYTYPVEQTALKISMLGIEKAIADELIAVLMDGGVNASS